MTLLSVYMEIEFVHGVQVFFHLAIVQGLIRPFFDRFVTLYDRRKSLHAILLSLSVCTKIIL